MTEPTPVTRFAAVLRADNPGPMTLDGTRSYVLRAPGSATCVVVDPGPDKDHHAAGASHVAGLWEPRQDLTGAAALAGKRGGLFRF